MSILGTKPADPVGIMGSGMPYSFTPAIYMKCKVCKHHNEKLEKERKSKRKDKKVTKNRDISAFLTPSYDPPFQELAFHYTLSSRPAEDESDIWPPKHPVIRANSVNFLKQLCPRSCLLKESIFIPFLSLRI